MSVAVSSTTGSTGAPRPTPPMTASELASFLKAELVGPGDVTITHVGTLEHGQEGTISFLRSGKFFHLLKNSRASAVLVTRGLMPPEDSRQRAILLVDDADLALNQVLELFAPAARPAPPGVHATSVVDPGATLGRGVSIGARCDVRAGAAIGDGTVLTSGVYIGYDVKIGRGVVLHPNTVVMDRCVIGDGCVLHAGVVIGADGFGYRPSPDGRGVVKIPHTGNVVIEPGVEIGANSCVDRAKFGSTVIGAGSKLDNLVQIGHGVQLGRACLLAAQVGIGGSCVIGDGVMFGGQAGVKDQLTIGPLARIAGGCGVIADVPAKATVGGFPSRDMNDWLRETVVLSKLAKRGSDARKRAK